LTRYIIRVGNERENRGGVMLTDDDIAALNQRAHDVGQRIGWELTTPTARGRSRWQTPE
jgi:hypothetical protein